MLPFCLVHAVSPDKQLYLHLHFLIIAPVNVRATLLRSCGDRGPVKRFWKALFDFQLVADVSVSTLLVTIDDTEYRQP